jgi:hypothetical protein
MKTIALKEKTFSLLEGLKRSKRISSFDELVMELVIEKEKIPSSFRGFLKGKSKRFTSKERDKIWKDNFR